MGIDQAKLYLDRALMDEQFSSSDITAVSNIGEGLYLDFKSGKLLDDKDASNKLREEVASFANSEGGLIIVGIDDTLRQVDGVHKRGGKTAEQWATTVLAQMVPRLLPVPKMHIASTDSGQDLLVIAVHRAADLIPVNSGGRAVYFVRLGDGKVPAPDYLISDLVLGRRRHPILTIEAKRPTINITSKHKFSLSFGFSVTNESLVHAPSPTIGIVAWSTEPTGELKPVPPSLREWIEVVPPEIAPPHSTCPSCQLMMTSRRTQQKVPMVDPLPPFETVSVVSGGAFHLQTEGAYARVQAAVFVVSEGHPPDWYQLAATVAPRHDGLEANVSQVTLERAIGRNPRASLSIVNTIGS